MEIDRVQAILNNKDKTDIFYNDRPIWIQELAHDKAKIGFVDNFEERDVYIKDLYERDLDN